MALSTIGTNSIADDAITAAKATGFGKISQVVNACLLYTSPSPRDGLLSRMPSSA